MTNASSKPNGHYPIIGAIVLLLVLIGSIGLAAVKLTDEYVRMAPTACSDAFISNANPYVWLPRSVSGVFYGQTINLHFDMVNGYRIDFYGVVHDGKLQNLKCGSTVDYDFDVTMSDLEALRLATSSRPIASFRDSWQGGSIQMKARDPKWQQESLERLAETLTSGSEEPVPEDIQSFFSQFLDK